MILSGQAREHRGLSFFSKVKTMCEDGKPCPAAVEVEMKDLPDGVKGLVAKLAFGFALSQLVADANLNRTGGELLQSFIVASAHLLATQSPAMTDECVEKLREFVDKMRAENAAKAAESPPPAKPQNAPTSASVQ